MVRAEVLIVGGGPAGAACAWALHQQGVDALILDRQPFPRLKLCAGWISAEVLQDLAFDAQEYPYGLTTIRRLHVSVKGLKFGVPARQLAIRRVEFDDWLLKRAGVPVQVHHVREIRRQDGGYLVDGAFWGRFLVGAGGTQCPVARTLFADANPRSRRALIVTLEEEFPYPHSDFDGYLWFLEDGLPGYAWYVPKVGGYVNVGVGGKASTLQVRGDKIQRHWDLLVQKLARLGLVRGYEFKPRGYAYYLREPRRQLRLDNAFVIGDAAGLATADMGEGISPAVKSGLLAAEAIVNGGDIDPGAIRTWSQPRVIARLLAGALG